MYLRSRCLVARLEITFLTDLFLLHQSSKLLETFATARGAIGVFHMFYGS